MLSSNLTSFMKKITSGGRNVSGQAANIGATFERVGRSLSASLLTPRVSKEKVATKTLKPIDRRVRCRVCMKKFESNEFSKSCAQCKFRICEDCASYSPEMDADFQCSVCRRKAVSAHAPSKSVTDIPARSETKVEGKGSQSATVLRKDLEKIKGKDEIIGAEPGCSREYNTASESEFLPNSPWKKVSIPRRGTSQRSTEESIKQADTDIAAHSGEKVEDRGAISATTSRKDLEKIKGENQIIGDEPGRSKGYDTTSELKSLPNSPWKGVSQPHRRTSFTRQCSTEEAYNVASTPALSKSFSAGLQITDSESLAGSRIEAPFQDRGRRSESLLLDTCWYPVVNSWPGFGLDDLDIATRCRFFPHVGGMRNNMCNESAKPKCVLPPLLEFVIYRDLTDRSALTQGLGMRVAGGKVGTFVYGVEPGGPAESAGIEDGDYIVEWNKVSLIDRSVDEVLFITQLGFEIVELLVKRPVCGSQSNSSVGGAGSIRRKLPKTPT